MVLWEEKVSIYSVKGVEGVNGVKIEKEKSIGSYNAVAGKVLWQ